MAMDGKITRYLEPQTLYEILEDSLITVHEEADTVQEVADDEDK